MDLLLHDEFSELLNTEYGPSVSLYMPTHAGGISRREDALRFKNLLAAADKKLHQEYSDTLDVRKMLRPARVLLEDDDFWKKCSHGLAVLITPETLRSYQLPSAFGELLNVANRFYLRPLIPAIASAEAGYVLALSHDHVRVYRVSQYASEMISVPDLPANIDAALGYTSVDRGSQTHASGRGPQRKQAAVFHGQGGKPDSAKNDLRAYFRQVDQAMCRYLRGKKAPLLLACVEYLVPLYREVNKYGNLMDDVAVGSPDRLTAHRIHEKAWDLLATDLMPSPDQALLRYQEIGRRAEATNDPCQILPAAYNGHVDVLFVDADRRLWGAYQEDAQIVDPHDDMAIDDQDLIELAAVETLRHRGVVYPLTAERLPSPAPMAAILRFAPPTS